MKRILTDNIFGCDNVYIPARKKVFVYIVKNKHPGIDTCGSPLFIFLSLRGKI